MHRPGSGGWETGPVRTEEPWGLQDRSFGRAEHHDPSNHRTCTVEHHQVEQAVTWRLGKLCAGPLGRGDCLAMWRMRSVGCILPALISGLNRPCTYQTKALVLRAPKTDENVG